MRDLALLALAGIELAEPGFLGARRPDHDRRIVGAVADVAQAVGRRHRRQMQLAPVIIEARGRPRKIAAALIGDERLLAVGAGIRDGGQAGLLDMARAAREQDDRQTAGLKCAHPPSPQCRGWCVSTGAKSSARAQTVIVWSSFGGVIALCSP